MLLCLVTDDIGGRFHVAASSGLDPLHLDGVSKVVKNPDFRRPVSQLVLERTEPVVRVLVVNVEALVANVQFCRSDLKLEKNKELSYNFLSVE
jgi:hypothetical protein